MFSVMHWVLYLLRISKWQFTTAGFVHCQSDREGGLAANLQTPGINPTDHLLPRQLHLLTFVRG